MPWYERYTTKANLWVFCFAWIGNYFWTHYFYRILGAHYTFQAWRLNDVRLWCLALWHDFVSQ
jgi:cycloeucalenol cycloisomerase